MGCDSLRQIIVSEENPKYTSLGGVLYSKDLRTLIQYPLGRPTDFYAIYDRTSCIGNSAFRYSTILTRIVIPDSVSKIGEYAFAYCTSLREVRFPYSLKIIENCAFKNCPALMSRPVLKSIISMGEGVFC